MKQPTNAEIRRVLKHYGRVILEGEGRTRPNTHGEVFRYCRALRRVWNLARRIAVPRVNKHG